MGEGENSSKAKQSEKSKSSEEKEGEKDNQPLDGGSKNFLDRQMKLVRQKKRLKNERNLMKTGKLLSFKTLSVRARV